MKEIHVACKDRNLQAGTGSCLSSQQGFTLIELLVVIAIIGLLAAMIFPVLSKARAAGKGAACISNLRQVGIALQLYIQDNNNHLPIMYDQYPGVPAKAPGPEVVLTNHLGNVQVLLCPADQWESEKPLALPLAGQTYFGQTGSSYAWNFLLNGEDAEHLEAMGLKFDPHEIPLMYDKKDFHAARGGKKGVNYLYGDIHIKNLLAVEGSIDRAR